MTYAPITPSADDPLIVAHQGSSITAPANTLASYELAAAQGAAIIEVDAHLTADGQLVIIHDDTLERTTDAATALPDGAPWNVRDTSLGDIRSLAAGTWEGERVQVPTLAEVIDLTRRLDLGLLVETKAEYASPELEPAIARLVRTYPDWEEWVPARLMIGSFFPDSLERARRELPGVNLAFIIGVLVADEDGTVLVADPAKPGVAEPGMTLAGIRDALVASGVGFLGLAVLGVHGQVANDFDAATVDFFRQAGIEVNVITDDAGEMRTYVGRGVSSILTNRPDVAAAVLGRR
jgi:glycerophosphoryl diester phosphodiesterase